MPQHRKTPIFIRVTSTDKTVICINPLQLSSFQILEGVEVRIANGARAPRGIDPAIVTTIKADTIALFYPSGTQLVFSVGIEITQADFNYLSTTLAEYLYLNEPEFVAKSTAIEQARIAEWNKQMDSTQQDERSGNKQKDS